MTGPPPAVEIDRVAHVYGSGEDGVVALSPTSLEIGRDELVAVVGPSGCGKSTLLRLIAGLVTPSEGAIRLSGRPVTRPTAEVGLVFQAPTLLPWATVLENVLFPLRMLGELDGAGVARARALLAQTGLDGFERRMPDELSGGMQQRAAICRGLVRDPLVLLMDEPFAALDALTREEMGRQLLELWAARPKAIVFVTHSVPEAVLLADRVVVMSARPGHVVDIVEVGLPRPRTIEMEGLDEFQRCARRIREHIYRRGAAAAGSAAPAPPVAHAA
jgi:NitT/TauT family transport system ATP-binding protein